MTAEPPATAAVADACLRENLPLRLAPPGLRPVLPGRRVAGPVLPARHSGSVDVFLEAITGGRRGDVLVIDNAGRTDEACAGDLTAWEAKNAGLAGLLVWGLVRDVHQLVSVALPVYSYGTLSAGPRRADARPADALSAGRFGDVTFSRQDWVFIDDDGAVFVPADAIVRVQATARLIQTREEAQARRVKEGTSLREQFRFKEYLAARAKDPKLTLREHLRRVGGEMEQ